MTERPPTGGEARDTRPGPEIWFVCGALLVIGIAYSISLGDRIRFPDERDYLHLANDLADHFKYRFHGRETAYRPPGYVFLLTPFVRFNSLALLRVLNFICLAGTSYLTYRLVSRYGNRIWSTVAAVAVAFYPVLFYSAGTLYPQVASTLPLVAGVLMLDRQVGRGDGDGDVSLSRIAWAGLLIGISVMMVPNHIILLVVAAIWLVVVSRTGGRKVALVLLAAGLALPMAWSVRNLITFREPVFISSNAGENLILGNSENTRPNSGVNVDITKYQRASRNMSENERDRYYRSAAFKWVRTHPGDAASLYVRKLINYFNFRNELYVQSQTSTVTTLIGAATYLPLVALLLVRLCLWRAFRPTRIEILILAFYGSSAILQAVFFTRVRFRTPVDALLLAALTIFLARAVDAYRVRRAQAEAERPAVVAAT